LHFPGRAPPYPPPDRFEHTTAGYVDHPQAGWGPVIGRERRRVRPMMAPAPFAPPAGDPTPITQVKVRTRAKSITGFSLSKPVPGFKTGYRFSGSRLTSLPATYHSVFTGQMLFLQANWYHGHAAPVTRSAQSRLGQLLTLALGNVIVTRILVSFSSFSVSR